MKPIYQENFSDEQSLLDSFRITKEAFNGAKVILAWYGYGDYCGSAVVILRKGDQLYEVNGSHCSCYGIEDQWAMEETTKAALRARMNEGSYGSYDGEPTFKTTLLEVLSKMRGVK